MPVLKRATKGMKNLRTCASIKANNSDQTYRAFRRVACIEMERVRLCIEKKAAINRQEKLDKRIQEIDREKAALLKIANDPEANTPSIIDPAVEQKRNKVAFKIKY